MCNYISLRVVGFLRGKKKYEDEKEDGKRSKKEKITLLCMDIYSYGFIALTRA